MQVWNLLHAARWKHGTQKSRQKSTQTHRTVHEMSQETGIHQSSLSQIICKGLPLKCFKRCHAQQLTDANYTARMKHAKLLLQNSHSMQLTLFSLRMKRCSRSLHPTISRTKSVADCENFWRRSLAFSLVRLLRGLPLPGRLSTVPVSRNFLNSLLTPRFVHVCSGNSSVNLCCVPLKIQTFYQNLSLITNTTVTSAVTNFRCHKLIATLNQA